MRYVLATLALLSILHSPAALSQDEASELAKLKQQNELLEAKLEAANLKIEKLEKQLAELKGDKDKKDKEKPRSLSDILVEEAVVGGDFRFTTTPDKGKWSLTINERDGKKFSGTYFVEIDGKSPGDSWDVKGLIGVNDLTFEVTGTAKLAARVAGKLRNQQLTLDYVGGAGNKAVLIAKDVK